MDQSWGEVSSACQRLASMRSFHVVLKELLGTPRVSANQGNFLRNYKTSPWMMPETDPRTSVTIEIMDVLIAGDAYTIVRNVLSQIINEKILVV